MKLAFNIYFFIHIHFIYFFNTPNMSMFLLLTGKYSMSYVPVTQAAIKQSMFCNQFINPSTYFHAIFISRNLLFFSCRGVMDCSLGQDHRRGAGILDLKYEAPDILLSCGYDSYLRLWDLRTEKWLVVIIFCTFFFFF